jgi:hypothetical protein
MAPSNLYNYTYRITPINSYSIAPGIYSPFLMYSTPIDNPAIANFYYYDQTLYAGTVEIVAAPLRSALGIVVKTQNNVDLGLISSQTSISIKVTPTISIFNVSRIETSFLS